MSKVDLSHVEKRYPDGTQAVSDMSLEILPGEFLCIIGPSGCGKSTTLRMIAGLESVSDGEIRIDGKNVINVPSRDRDIAMVFENYALYPHLNVFGNIAMPLVARKTPKEEIRQRVDAVARTLDISMHLKAKPRQLSGGQRQRVSLARAMIRRPKIFLMDEPLGHLEAYMRVDLRREIRRLHEVNGGTTIYITHDQKEAAAISDRVAVMSDGRLLQVGTIRELLDRPATRFVAEFVGEPPINIFEDIEHEAGMLHVAGTRLPMSDKLVALLAKANCQPPLSLGIRPDDLSLMTGCNKANGLDAEVVSVQPMGDWAAVICRCRGSIVTIVVPEAEMPHVGAPSTLSVQMDNIHVFDASGTNVFLKGEH